MTETTPQRSHGLGATARAAALQNLYAVCRSKRLPAADQARVAYAAAALEEDTNLAQFWLGEALARLGDADGAKEVFTTAAAQARNRDKIDLARAWQRAKDLLALEQKTPPEVTLSTLRQAGWNGIRHTISLVTPTKTGRKVPCPRCAGAGDIPAYVHIADGICFLCWGSKTIWEKKSTL